MITFIFYLLNSNGENLGEKENEMNHLKTLITAKLNANQMI
jgi:hypothetical protein